VEAVKNENPQHLVLVLKQLDPKDLRALLTAHDGIIKCLVEAAQDRHEHLVLVLSRLHSDALNTLLTQRINSADSSDTIINLLVEKGTPEHLVLMFGQLKPDDLNTLLTTHDGI
jgi:16S rRNA U1498 N3-methylase RsmE